MHNLHFPPGNCWKKYCHSFEKGTVMTHSSAPMDKRTPAQGTISHLGSRQPDHTPLSFNTGEKHST